VVITLAKFTDLPEFFHAEYVKVFPVRCLPLLPPADVTTDAPVTVADLHGPDLPALDATVGISARSPADVFDALESSPQGLTAASGPSVTGATAPG
jgi:hypothetical protein